MKMDNMKKLLNKKNIISIVSAALICILITYIVSSRILPRHYQSLLVPIGVNIILAVSLNLTVGFLGELTLGHAGFMSVGAYAGCLFTVYANLPVYIEFPIALMIGGLVAAIFGVIISWH